MFKMKSVHSMAALAGGVMLTAAILLGGCSGKEESSSSKKTSKKPTPTTVSKVDGPTVEEKKVEASKPATAKTLPADLGTKIANAKDLFAWFEMREIYTKAGVTDSKVEEALKTKETELLKANPPKAVTKGLELVAFDWKRQQEVKSTEMTKHKLAMLFKVTAKPSLKADQKMSFYWRAYPKPEHLQVLAKNGIKNYYQKDQPPQFIESWPAIVPPPEKWDAGTYVLITRELDAPRLPYRMEMHFSRSLKNGQNAKEYGFVTLPWAE